MNGVIFHGPGQKSWDRVDDPRLEQAAVSLHLERLWSQNITITTRLVDTISIPQLLTLIAARRFDPTMLATHTFALEASMEAYDVFSRAGETDALKVGLKSAVGEHATA